MWHSKIYGFSPKLFIIVLSTVFTSPGIRAQEGTFLARIQKDIQELVQKVEPSVVTVTGAYDIELGKEQGNNYFRNDPSTPELIEINNIGSGFILDSMHVITNASVVYGSKSIQIVFYDSSIVPGQLLGTDEDYGIAVLKFNRASVKPAVIAPKKNPLHSGNWIFIVSNSLGVTPAVSFGSINCVRSDGIIQLGTTVTAGSAGGPIFDTLGNLIGLLAASFNFERDGLFLQGADMPSETVLGYPIHEIVHKSQQIIAENSKNLGWIGVQAEDWPGQTGGIHINQITAQGPADRANLHVGDIIVSMNNTRIKNARELADWVKRTRPGELINFEIIRSSGVHHIQIVVGSHVNSPIASQSASLAPTVKNAGELPGVMQFQPQQNPPPNDQVKKTFLLMRLRNLEQEVKTLKSMINK